MRILGIDPALATLGWGIINTESSKFKLIASGIISTKSTELMPKRLADISLAIENIIIQYQPNMVAMEETFVNMNAISSLKLGYARGAIMAIIGKFGLEFRELKPNLIKKTVVGVGHAEKHQILHMVKLLIAGASEITKFDEADAIATAYTCSVHTDLSSRLNNR